MVESTWFPKAGRDALDPLNRNVRIERIEGDIAVCRARGPYAATLHLNKSSLRPVPERYLEKAGENTTQLPDEADDN